MDQFELTDNNIINWGVSPQVDPTLLLKQGLEVSSLFESIGELHIYYDTDGSLDLLKLLEENLPSSDKTKLIINFTQPVSYQTYNLLVTYASSMRAITWLDVKNPPDDGVTFTSEKPWEAVTDIEYYQDTALHVPAEVFAKNKDKLLELAASSYHISFDSEKAMEVGREFIPSIPAGKEIFVSIDGETFQCITSQKIYRLITLSAGSYKEVIEALLKLPQTMVYQYAIDYESFEDEPLSNIETFLYYVKMLLQRPFSVYPNGETPVVLDGEGNVRLSQFETTNIVNIQDTLALDRIKECLSDVHYASAFVDYGYRLSHAANLGEETLLETLVRTTLK